MIEREPARAHYRGRDVLTNPPPSSGGILIAYSLDLLERLGRPGDLRALVEVMDRTNKERAPRSSCRASTPRATSSASWRRRRSSPRPPSVGSRLGSTTHVAVLDADGACASVTCSNGSCSGVIVPGTGLHLNNMLGEEDLNPLGFHRHEPGRRIPSMMAPTVVLRDGRPEVALGSAGSNRIRSAILQTILRVVDDGLPAQEAVAAPRVHFEGELVEAEPGIDERARGARARRLEGAALARAQPLLRRRAGGGARPGTGELSGGGDPRRGARRWSSNSAPRQPRLVSANSEKPSRACSS